MPRQVNNQEANAEVDIPRTQGAGESDAQTQALVKFLTQKTQQRLSKFHKLLKKEIAQKAQLQANDIKRDLQKELDQKQLSVIEALAIFVALFTFISVNITIFQKAKDLHSAVTFMILMAFVSMVMMSFPVVLLKSNRGEPIPAVAWIVLGVAVLLFFVTFHASAYLNFPLNFTGAP